MKHIKIFEEYSSLYTKLDSTEFIELWKDCIYICQKWFTKAENDWEDVLNDSPRNSREFGKGYLIGTSHYDDIFPVIQKMPRGIWMQLESFDVFIWEMDDYYFLVIITPIKYKNNYPILDYENSQFAKCDQFEGVNSLIIDTIRDSDEDMDE